MKLNKIALIALVSILSVNAHTQITGYNATIKSGLAFNSVDIFVTPTGSGSSTVQFSQFNIVVGVTQACRGGAPMPTATPSLSSFVSTNFGSYATPVFNQNGAPMTILGTNYYVWDINYNQSNSSTASLTVGTEYKLATITFTGSTPGCAISLLDDQTNSSANTYIADATSGNFYSPQLFNMSFYNGVAGGGNGASTVDPASGAAGVKVTTNNTVSLPVTFSSYDVKCNDKGALLTWSTSSEVNSSKFEIQRSKNGVDWTTVGTVAAAGNSSDTRNYQYVDISGGGTAQYRIRQVDIDGRFTYTAVRLTSCKTQVFDVVLYPVPANDKLNVVVKSDIDLATELKIVDMSGKIVSIFNAQLQKGSTNLTVSTLRLANGQYMLISTDPAVNISSKFVVAH